MKMIILVMAAAAASCAIGATSDADGGLVKTAGKGRLAVVDCTSGLDRRLLEKPIKNFTEMLRIEIDSQKGAPFSVEGASAVWEQSKANAVLFVGDRADYPLTLAASEQKWCFVNVAPLKADAAKYEKRLQYLVLRGIYRALGADTSRATTSCMGPVFSVEDLDKLDTMDAPMDSFMAINEALPKLGIEPIEYLTFREACELDNPPTPTNDVQRAIAAEVKAALQKQKK